MEYKIPRAEQGEPEQRKTNERNTVIKIMRLQQRELVGVVRLVALFQRCGFSSSKKVCCLGFTGLMRHSAAKGSNQFFVTIKNKL